MAVSKKDLTKSLGTKPRKGKVKICAMCGKEIYVRPSELAQTKFCSYACHGLNQQRKVQVECTTCGTEFYRVKSQVKKKNYCTKACVPNVIAVKGGKAPEPNLRKLDTVFSLIVRERDGRCLRCGATTYLQCSHVIPKGSHPRMRYILANAKTLCRTCHIYWWHKYPHAASLWFDDTWPGLYDTLRDYAISAPKVDRTEMLAELNKIYKEKKYKPYGKEQ